MSIDISIDYILNIITQARYGDGKMILS